MFSLKNSLSPERVPPNPARTAGIFAVFGIIWILIWHFSLTALLEDETLVKQGMFISSYLWVVLTSICIYRFLSRFSHFYTLANHRIHPRWITIAYAVYGFLWLLIFQFGISLIINDPIMEARLLSSEGILLIGTASIAIFLFMENINLCAEFRQSNLQEALPMRKIFQIILPFVALSFIIPLICFGIIKISAFRLEADVFTDLKMVAELKARHMEGWLIERENATILSLSQENFVKDVETLMRHPENRRAYDAIKNPLNTIRLAQQYKTIALIDARGRTVMTTGQALKADPLFEERKNTVIKTAEKRIAENMHPRSSRMYFFIPLFSTQKTGHFLGVIYAEIDASEHLVSYLKNWPPTSAVRETLLMQKNDDGTLMAYRQDGTIVAYYRGKNQNRITDYLAESKDSLPRTIECLDYRGVRVFGAWHPVQGSNWFITVKQDKDRLLLPLREQAFWISILCIAIFFVFSLILIYIWRSQHRAQKLILDLREEQLLGNFYNLPFIGMGILSAGMEQWQHVNERLCEILGYSHDEIIHVSWAMLDASGSLPEETDGLMEMQKGDSNELHLEKQFFRKDGSIVNADVHIRCVRRADHSIDYFMVTLDDTTKRKENEQQLHRLNQLYAALSECNQSIIRCQTQSELFDQVCIDMVTYAGMQMAWIGLIDPATQAVRPVASHGDNFNYLEKLKVSANENDPAGAGPIGYCIRENRSYWLQDMHSHHLMANWRSYIADYPWNSLAILPLHNKGNVIGIFALYAEDKNAFDEASQNLLSELTNDIDFAIEHFEREEEIHRLARFDSVTSLPNRSFLQDMSEQAISIASRRNESLALLFLDLDNFKTVNDSLGHSIGDALLKLFAERLRTIMRKQDTVSRQGGDEFVIVLPGADTDGAAFLAERVLGVALQPYNIERHEISLAASIGIAMYPKDGTSFEELLRCADAAMYQAKDRGRNNYCFFTNEMQDHSVRMLALDNALRRAIERGQFTLHYQPQMSLQTGEIFGFEALLRWNHPELGAVSPAEFIPVAESNGEIVRIGEWVLQTAIQQLKTWHAIGLDDVVMSVNLSAVQFRHPRLTEMILDMLEKHQVSPDCLQLELTEGAMMKNPVKAIDILNSLNRHGIQVSIDDFGTGYSSLAYLKRFNVDTLKIDRSFIRNVPDDPEDVAIVEAVISLAKSLQITTIAEGVETEEQLDFLLSRGCNEIQGYLLSPPIPPDRVPAFWQAHLAKQQDPE